MTFGPGSSFLSAFLASLVEAVEALTIVLAAGATRGWKPALSGAAVAFFVLIAVIAVGGPFLHLLPLTWLRIGLGLVLLWLGTKWLKKSILRASGIIPERDEARVYARTQERLQGAQGADLGTVGWVTAFNAVFIEGVEIVLIVLSLGAAGNSLAWSITGALAACLAVIVLGVVVHRPLTRVPENWLKFVAGILLTGFGLFWFVEGLGATWPGGDAALPGLFLLLFALSFAAIGVLRRSKKPVA